MSATVNVVFLWCELKIKKLKTSINFNINMFVFKQRAKVSIERLLICWF